MLVLLPPSEGKTAPAAGPALDLDRLSHPDLGPWRSKVLDALAEVSARPDALEVLGVGHSLAAEVARNTELRAAPTAPAREVYTGVLYAAAGLDRLGSAAAARADAAVRVVSALWGLVGPSDPIPAYRLSMGTDLPGVGPLAAAWREPLGEVLGPLAAGGLVVDCRSSTYLAAWRPGRDVDHVGVTVLRDGKVVSHHAKHTRGVLVGHLLRRGPLPADRAALLAAAGELVGPDSPGPRVLDARLDARTLVLTVA